MGSAREGFVASLGSARHRAGLVLPRFPTAAAPAHPAPWLCPFSCHADAAFPCWFLASRYCSALSPCPAILFRQCPSYFERSPCHQRLPRVIPKC